MFNPSEGEGYFNGKVRIALFIINWKERSPTMSALLVKTQPYPARVKEIFWFPELRQAIAFLQDSGTLAQLKQKSEEENFFGATSVSRALEIRRVVERRLKAVDASFYAFFLQSPLETQKLLALTLVLLTDHTFFRFMDDCFREKVMTGNFQLDDRDFFRVFRDIQEEDPKTRKWTDATLKHIRSNYRVIMKEAGILTGTKSPYKIQKPLISQALHNFFQQEGLGDIEKIYTGARI